MRSPGTEAAAISVRPPRTRLLGALAWLVGLGLIAGLISAHSFDQVRAALALAGWSMVLIGLVHLGVLLADTLGWSAVVPGARRPRLWSLAVKRWIGSSVNSLLPVAQIGGEVVRADLLARSGVAGPVAGASVVVDLTIGLITQLAFILFGLGLYLAGRGGVAWALQAGAGLTILALLVLGFGLLQWRGLFLRLAHTLQRVTRGRAWQGLVGSAALLDRAIVARYRDRGRLAACAGWRLVGWLWGSAELWLAFWLLDQPIGLAEAVILESLGQTMRSVGFMLPGGLGAQESGIVAAGLMLGIAPDLALAVALLKRTREVVYGVPGLIAWSLLGLRAREPEPALGRWPRP